MGSLPRIHDFDRWLLSRLLLLVGEPPLRVTLHDAEALPGPRSPAGTVRFRDRCTLLRLLVDPEVAFGEDYAAGAIRTEGDLVAILEAIYRAMEQRPRRTMLEALSSHVLRFWQANTLRGSRRNIRQHYDLSPEFFRQWLDSELLYSCAYFPSPSATLEAAQSAKMEHICRKLWLEPGETVVEAGSGWGALALYMARNRGVSVKAFNVSHEQIVYARQRARSEGLDGRVEFIEDDYRNIRGKFDAFVSVGMLEHVGAARYRDLGRSIQRSIGTSGRGLLHFIGRSRPAPLSRWLRLHIFPGAYAPALSEAAAILEPWEYSVLDVENLRTHYARTVEHWLDRFERSYPHCAQTYDERFLRTWRLYLAGSIAAFRTGSLQLFQIVFAGRDCARVPWTRRHLYGAQTGGLPDLLWTDVTS